MGTPGRGDADHKGAEPKPAVYLLVIVPITAGGGLGLVVALLVAYCRITGIPLAALPNRNGLLLSLPAFLLWVPAGLLLANVVLHAVAPLRRIAERYAARAGQPGYGESQKMLLQALGAFAVICVPLIVLGFLL
jgi:hypothetical protein